jgi:molybdopterin-guanine dinucleotide biosynthesis protein A
MAEALLRKGAAGLQSLLALVDVRYVEPEEMGDMERWRRSCFSVNTEADLEQARSWAAAGAG